MCFSLEWLKEMLIMAVVVIAIVAILQIIVSYVLAKLSLSGMFADIINIVSQVIKILIWAVIIIALIIFCFSVISCLWSYAGSGGALFPHGR